MWFDDELYKNIKITLAQFIIFAEKRVAEDNNRFLPAG